jgi:hypothetical protein
MEPGGIEPPTSCLQSNTADDPEEAEKPERTGDSGDVSGAPD